TAGQLAQHLLQLLLHLGQLLLERLEVGRPALLVLEIGAQLGLAVLQPFQFLALGARHRVPQQAENQQRQQDAEADLVLARPASHVADVEFPQRHLLLAHWAAPSAGAAGSALTGRTGSGMPSPSSSLGALGLASWTDRLNM